MAVVVTLVTVFAANAQTPERLFINAGQATRLDIAENMNVVLVQATASDSTMTIGKDASRKLRVGLSGEELTVAPAQHLSKNTVVYIAVRNLQKLTLGEATRVESEGTLSLNKLDMYLHDDCLVKLRTNGNVKAYSLGQFEVILKRTPAIASVMATAF